MGVEPHDEAVPETSVDDVGGVEHLAVAHGDGTDLLGGRVPHGLAEGGFDGRAVPARGTGAFHLRAHPSRSSRGPLVAAAGCGKET